MGSVTILLISLYARGNDSCHTRKQSFNLFQKRSVLSLQMVPNLLAVLSDYRG